MFVEGSNPSLLHAYPAAGRQEWKTVLIACMFSKHYRGSISLHLLQKVAFWIHNALMRIHVFIFKFNPIRHRFILFVAQAKNTTFLLTTCQQCSGSTELKKDADPD